MNDKVSGAPGARRSTRQESRRIGPMVRRLALQRKMPSAQIDCHIRGPGTAGSAGVNSVTIETRAPQGAVPRFRPLLSLG